MVLPLWRWQKNFSSASCETFSLKKTFTPGIVNTNSVNSINDPKYRPEGKKENKNLQVSVK